ncbi:MAG: type I-U CRISPR-associated helicase/endonuclease Cas3 [Chthoniobacterales bacterium]
MSFPERFLEITGFPPFSWQERLYERFRCGDFPDCDLPTGLGKTSIMTIWLIALIDGLSVPRRLVYVVDRRAVVDQATDEAMRLRDYVADHPELELGAGLPISTLRGQRVDNREWLADPTAPAVIVGTVDMVGSRLLFEGYGVSRKMRPYQAGLLGCDTLVLLDEAHLVAPFEKMLGTVACPADELGFRTEVADTIVPRLRLMSLSATSRGDGNYFEIDEADLKDGTVTRTRMTARKRLNWKDLAGEEKLADGLARVAWHLADEGRSARKIVVFSSSREVAKAAHAAIGKLSGGDKKAGVAKTPIYTELLVGGRRVYEREKVATWLRERGFVGEPEQVLDCPAIVFATAAGEVGVDMDADHLVCDLVAWERMIQRLGRVNRRGGGNARVVVCRESEVPPKAAERALAKPPAERSKKDDAVIARFKHPLRIARASAEVFSWLPSDDDGIDVSPMSLRNLKLSLAETGRETDEAGTVRRREMLDQATTEEPLRPQLIRPIVEAWAMTSLHEHTARPRVQPWLRGWVEDEPQTTVLWRRHLPVGNKMGRADAPTNAEREAFFEAAPPHLSEKLEVRTSEVLNWLKKRAQALRRSVDRALSESKSPPAHLDPNEPCGLILASDGELRRAEFSWAELEMGGNAKKAERNFVRQLTGGVLILDERFAGLAASGLLDPSENKAPRTLDGLRPWLADDGGVPAIKFRVRSDIENGPDETWRKGWVFRFRCVCERLKDGEPERALVVEKWRGATDGPDDAAATSDQSLDDHQRLTERHADRMARNLGLPPAYREMLCLAARHHDEGKRNDRWQDAFHAPLENRPYAKTKGPINQRVLGGYRHEFESVVCAEAMPGFRSLPQSHRDLALHLIAAHHGFARPVIATKGNSSLPPSLLRDRACEIASRYARLQEEWGPWALAWWESLLRAADHLASRDADQTTQPPETAAEHV